MKVSVIIVTYNSADFIKDCLESVINQQDIDKEIIVVDNNSQDNTIEILQSYQSQIALIQNQQNLGFGKANNQAFKQSHGDYIFLLNPDAVLQTTHDLNNMLQFMLQNREHGMAGCRIISPDGHEESLPYYEYPNARHIKTNFKDLPGKIAWLLGACLLLPREVYEKSHGFDEDFFLYGEEVDWALRIRKLGYSLGYNSNVVIKHIGGASEKKQPSFDTWTRKQNGLHLFWQKNYSPEDCQWLVKRDLKKAKRRLFQLALKKRLFGLNKNDDAKLERYQAIYKTSKVFLASYCH